MRSELSALSLFGKDKSPLLSGNYGFSGAEKKIQKKKKREGRKTFSSKIPGERIVNDVSLEYAAYRHSSEHKTVSLSRRT